MDTTTDVKTDTLVLTKERKMNFLKYIRTNHKELLDEYKRATTPHYYETGVIYVLLRTVKSVGLQYADQYMISHASIGDGGYIIHFKPLDESGWPMTCNIDNLATTFRRLDESVNSSAFAGNPIPIIKDKPRTFGVEGDRKFISVKNSDGVTFRISSYHCQPLLSFPYYRWNITNDENDDEYVIETDDFFKNLNVTKNTEELGIMSVMDAKLLIFGNPKFKIKGKEEKYTSILL